MKTRMAITWVTGMIVVVLPGTVHAQQHTAPRAVEWGNLAVRIILFESHPVTGITEPYNGSVSISYNRVDKDRRFFHQLAWNKLAAPISSGVDFLSYSRGIGNLGRYHRGAFFAGAAFIWGNDPDQDPELTRYTLGLHLNAQAAFMPLRKVGIGIDVFANINFFKSVVATRVLFTIGGLPR